MAANIYLRHVNSIGGTIVTIHNNNNNNNNNNNMLSCIPSCYRSFTLRQCLERKQGPYSKTLPSPIEISSFTASPCQTTSSVSVRVCKSH
jgi:hypothetical protein